ncbi:MATE efflux family protein expressed [Zostera marina]|uniref:Protein DETOXIFICATION n=1 Tax=Zostera marina TaxID=29655 RepID=A0A0K9NZI5_ZOSMR|nr:MATE efflux family protein expressed [Zostera marina]
MAAGGTAQAHRPLFLPPFLPSVPTRIQHSQQPLKSRKTKRSRIRCCTTPPPKFSNEQPPEPITHPPPDATPPKPNNLFVFSRIGVDGVLLDIASIALPAALALAADPLTSLVDTAYVGHVGSVELAAVGVSISVFNFISKLFNVPLLNITTSFVAEESALDEGEISQQKGDDGKLFLPAVSTSLVLAGVIGIVEALVLFFGSGILVHLMGIQGSSPMRIPAEQFLRLRAFGAPAIVTALAAQGAFRGFMDTKTPLYAVGVGNLLNAILDPIMIFVFGLGIDGAAMATVIADFVIAFILLWNLNTQVILVPSNIDVEKTIQYLKSGVLLTGRTVAVVGTITLSTSMAASAGPIQMAGHQICMQIWLAVSLLNDALALAGQALLASEYTKGNYKQARTIIYRVLQIGLGTGISLAVILFIGYGTFCSLFTADDAVLDIARCGMIFVTASQPINALAFVLDGLYYGVSDFSYAAYSMGLVGLTSSLALLILAPAFGLAGVWAGLFLFMMLRVAAGFWRLGSKRGPWKAIWSDIKDINILDR